MGIARNTLLSLLLLALASAAWAEEFHLRYDDRIIGGQTSFDLLRELGSQHRVDPAEFEILGVDVIAKSQQGGGQVWLGSAYSQSGRQTAPGSIANYSNPADWTFGTLRFQAGGMGDALNLNFYGNIKLREIVLHTRRKQDAVQIAGDHQGNRRITLQLNHVVLNGLTEINLKQELRRKTDLNPDRYNLKGIEVGAKSRSGNAKVWLESGNRKSQPLIVGGIPQAFDNDNTGSYDRKFIQATPDNQPTPWLLRFSGNVKVNDIVINLAPR